MMQAVWDGVTGKMAFLQGGWHWQRDPAGIAVKRDGGRFIEQASHHTDVMSWAMKDAHPVRCTAMGFSHTGAKPNEFSETESTTIFEFPGGVLFNYTHLWCLPKKFETETLRAFGEKGCMDFNQAVFTGLADGKEQRYGDVIGQDWGSGTPESMAHFVDNIKTGNRKPWASVETGRICSLMCMMARMAMVDAKKNAYEPSVIKWKDLGSTTDL
jgi:predicted dehydrogenase